MLRIESITAELREFKEDTKSTPRDCAVNKKIKVIKVSKAVVLITFII